MTRSIWRVGGLVAASGASWVEQIGDSLAYLVRGVLLDEVCV